MSDDRTQAASEALMRLADDVWQDRLERSPLLATYLGDGRADDRLDALGEDARRSARDAATAFLRRLSWMGELPRGSEAEITRRVLELSLGWEVERFEHHAWEWSVDPLQGLHVLLQNLMTFQPLGDDEAWTRLVLRLEAVPAAFREHAQNLKDGLDAWRLPPRVAVVRVLQQLDAFLARPIAATPFVAVPLSRAPEVWDAGRRDAWADRLTRVVASHVRPSYETHRDFLRRQVLPGARDEVGIWSMPGGDEAYAHLIRTMTTTELTPDEIHEIGREELASNRAEMLAIARDEGHTGDLASYLASLREDPRFRLDSREAILDRYRTICAEMDEALPRVFGRLPEARYEVRALEAFREDDAPAAYYQRPPEDCSRAGIFWANTRDPASWPTYDFRALCYHEAVPGHHLQIALAQETPGLPAVRRHGGFTAYVEGWAHYAERLADEMGMYPSPHDRLGMLSAQAWRAARLVVDTGMHHLRWSRDQALELMRSIRAGTGSDVENEVDRYIVWPGQALAYKVGSRLLTDLRERLRARLGARFELPAFHDELLRHGALPLDLLGEVMREWAVSPGNQIS